MEKFPIYRSTKQLPGVGTAVRANYNTDTGEAQMWGAVGNAASAVERTFTKLEKQKQAIEQKRMDMEDFNFDAQANSIREIDDAEFEVYKRDNPPDTWEAEKARRVEAREKVIGEFPYNNQDSQNSQKLKGETRKEIGEAKVFIDSTKGIAAATIEVQEKAFITGVRTGDPVMQADAEEALRSVQKGMNSELLDSKILDLRTVGEEMRHKDAVERIEQEAAANPDQIQAEIIQEKEVRKKGDGSEKYKDVTDKDLGKAYKYAKSAKVTMEVKVNDDYDLKTGKAVEDFTKAIQDGTFTEDMVWGAAIDVSPEKAADLGALRDRWAGIARGINERKLALTDKTKAKAIKEKYNPSLVSMLKTQAENAKSDAEVQAIISNASSALAESQINGDDLESITVKATNKFVSLVDTTISDMETDYKRVALVGTDDNSLVNWVKAQTILKPAGVKLDSAQLLKDFYSVAKAKNWSVNETTRVVVDKVEKENITDLDKIRKLYLQTQRRWLNKSDTQLVKEYNTWLTIE